jgi:tetratricopeptide (TPR) repeat protein
MMKHKTRKKLIQLSLSAAFVLVVWGLLTITGPSLVEEKAVQDWVAKKEWLSFINPNIRVLLIGYWRLFAALLLTGSFLYPRLRNPADYLARHYFLQGPLLTLSWGPADDGLPQPEFRYFCPPGSCQSPGLVLMNNGIETTTIKRVELSTGICRRISDLGTEMLTSMGISPLHFENMEQKEGIALEWKKLEENCWVIDTPFALQEGAKVDLPSLGLGYSEQDENALTQLRSLVGLATLGIQFDARLLTEQGIINVNVSAPLRILLSLEEGGDGGIGGLVNKLDVQTEAERDRIRHAHERARHDDFQIRRLIAQNLNEMEAAKRLESADQAIELQPKDPTLHYARGHTLAELGRYQEALASLDKALCLALDNPDLHLDRGAVLRGLSRPQEALDEIDRVLTARPNDAAAYAEKGRILMDLERKEDALAAFNNAIQLDEGLTEGYCGRGLALIQLDADADALAAFDHAIELDPNSALAHVGRALALSDCGRDDEVLAALKKALGLGYSDLSPLRGLESLMQEGNRTKYRQLLDSYDLLESYNSSSGENSGESDTSEQELTRDQPKAFDLVLRARSRGRPGSNPPRGRT